MMSESFTVRGIQVYQNYYSTEEPTITHGIIELENLGKNTVCFSIRQVRCLAQDDAILMDSFFVYGLPEYNEEDPKNIHQRPLTTVQYEISFPSVSAIPYLNREIQIEVEVKINDEVVLVNSTYRLIKRIKRRP
ncbi:MAG: hypothetical protein ACE5FD_00825 [Anaerolineae bacterium]